MNRIRVALIAAPLLIATGAVAAGQQPDSSEKTERRICRSEQKTGSLVPRRRVCRTESEWREIKSRDRVAVEAIQDAPTRPCSYSTTSTSC